MDSFTAVSFVPASEASDVASTVVVIDIPEDQEKTASYSHVWCTIA
ncbi:hypothetical protein H1R20_g10632, partial [Candolleomyces eurysporus]